MQPIELNEEQLKKVVEMSKVLLGVFNVKWLPRFSPLITIWKNNAGDYSNFHWLELCLYHIAPLVAASHGKQPFTTPEWSKHLVLQKLINELHRVNPIDTLYDIWKHPEKYAQDL